MLGEYPGSLFCSREIYSLCVCLHDIAEGHCNSLSFSAICTGLDKMFNSSECKMKLLCNLGEIFPQVVMEILLFARYYLNASPVFSHPVLTELRDLSIVQMRKPRLRDRAVSQSHIVTKTHSEWNSQDPKASRHH